MTNTITTRLKKQNDLSGYVLCEFRNQGHRWQISKAQFVGRDPVAVYVPCARCPAHQRVTIKPEHTMVKEG